ncbi:cytochrome C, partial [bacterium]|nr:cytochrome C [bacterium]
MKRIFLILAVFGFVLSLVISGLKMRTVESTPLERLKASRLEQPSPSADHSKFEILKQEFDAPQEVTEACISCHTERHKEVMASSHWNWERLEYIEGQGIRSVGKKNILNNFCVGISGNEQVCNRCHIGYGYADASFDFGNPDNVDCLACHDNSGAYIKEDGGAGLPDPSVDLNLVAQQVGRPKRDNCGTCHFFGGGGNNVKHGDLDVALLETTRDVDVHMGIDGADMQ